METLHLKVVQYSFHLSSNSCQVLQNHKCFILNDKSYETPTFLGKVQVSLMSI